jgi:hypothetical protein
MPYTSLGNISGDKFEIFRNDSLIVAGVMKTDIFQAINVELGSEPHPVTKKALYGKWHASDFRYLPQGEELFKVVARQQLAKLVTEEEKAPSWGGRK